MMRFSTHTTDDYGDKDLKEAVKAIKKRPYVEIGILEQDGSKAADTHASKSGTDKKTTHPTLAQVATWNEFGAVTSKGVVIPERSFIRGTVNANLSKYDALVKQLISLVAQKTYSTETALGLLGQKIQADIVNRINAGIAPENAPSTIAAKGSSKPLVDTGQLKQSIRYAVFPAGGSK